METRQEFNDRVDNSYQKEKLRIDEILDRLSDNNKIFLDEMIDKEEFGSPFLFAIFDFLEPNVDDLQTVDSWLGGEISYLFSKFKSNGSDIVKLVDLFVQLQHFQLESKEEIDTDKLIKKLKRDVYELKKKLEQPQDFINTKQFEDRFGLSQAQQKSLRSKMRDPLPHTITNGKTILYETEKVSKWLENYSKE
jgi:hypothetical protein